MLISLEVLCVNENIFSEMALSQELLHSCNVFRGGCETHGQEGAAGNIATRGIAAELAVTGSRLK
jgi:hypothetical protein